MSSAPLPAEAWSEQRSATRYTPIIRTAKLVSQEGEMLCIVRDVSDTGLKVRLFSRLPAAGEMMLEFRNGERQPVIKVWQKDDSAGFRFARDVDVARLLEDGKTELRRTRPIRLNLSCPAVVETRSGRFSAAIKDISQQGARIECAAHLAVSELIRLQLGRHPSISAKVRWRTEPAYGLVFDETFQFDELARLTAQLQRNEMGKAKP